MQMLHDFLTTDYGLLSAASILAMLIGLGYFVWYVTSHVREDCARQDRLAREGQKG
jgi:Protein of unknown function (DUF3149)